MPKNATDAPMYQGTLGLTGEVTTLFTTTTTTVTTFTTTMYNMGQKYDEGVLHLVAVISSVVVFVGLVLAIKSIVGFLNRLNRREGDLRDNTRPSSSFLQWLRDEPPPYPGKYSRTNVNYLPSYLSAIEMEQERQRQETATMSQPARDLPEVSSESSVIMFTAPEDGVVCLKDSRNSDSQTFSQSRVNETSTTVENVINEVLIANQIDEEDAQLEENRLRAPTAMDDTPAVDNRVTLA